MQLYFFFVLNYLLFILAAFTKIPIKIYIVWILSVFSIIAFCYDPILQAEHMGGEGVDLCRHFDSLDLVRVGDYDNLYPEAPLSALYIYIIATLFSSNHLLPVVSMMIFYIISLYTILKICNKFNANDEIKRYGILLFIILYNFFSSMNNIRYPIATALFFLIVFYEVIEKKKIIKFFYSIPILMHPGTILFLMTRIISCIRTRYAFLLFGTITVGFIYKFDFIIQALINASSPVPEIQALLIAISYKLISYSANEVYDVPLIYRVMNIYNVFVLGMMVLLSANYFGKTKRILLIRRMAIAIFACSLVGIITNFMDGNFTDRMIESSAFIIEPLYIALLVKMKEKNNHKSYIILKNGCILMGIFYLLPFLFKIYPNWIAQGL